MLIRGENEHGEVLALLSKTTPVVRCFVALIESGRLCWHHCGETEMNTNAQKAGILLPICVNHDVDHVSPHLYSIKSLIKPN